MPFLSKFVSSFVRGGLLVQIFLLLASPCFADELEPRRWAHLPINTNFGGTAYAYTEADIDVDPLLKIEDAEMELHSWALKYI